MTQTPEGSHSIVPQLVVEDARGLLDFVQHAFGATDVDMYDDGDRIVHAEVMIGNSKIYIAAANEDFPPFPAMLNLFVEDVDVTHARAIEHGASNLRKPEDQFYGDRTGGVLDPEGNQWWISTHVEDVPEAEVRRRMAGLSD